MHPQIKVRKRGNVYLDDFVKIKKGHVETGELKYLFSSRYIL